MGSYTSIEKISNLLQITIDEVSVPDEDAVTEWITEIEARVTERALGSHTATDQYIDVPTVEEIGGEYSWYYRVKNAKLKFHFAEGLVVPLGRVKSPILSITSLYKNDEDPSDAPNWEQLTEGPGDGSHFILLTSGTKDLGYALWFYDEEPKEGPKRLKMTYKYGFNIDSNILSDWCTLNVAIKVLLARMGTNQADGLAYLEGGDLGTYMNTNYRERIEEIRKEISRIEENYFPPEEGTSDIAVGVL